MSFNNTKTPSKPTVKAKWQVPQRKHPTAGVMEYYLTDDLREKFCKLFPVHSNQRIMKWFGISFSTLQRFKRQLGLKKDMTKIRKELAKDIKKICEDNGWYDSLRGKQPPEQCVEAMREKFRTGWHPLKVVKENNPRRYKRIMQKRSEKRKQLIESERRRVIYGLTPKTNLTNAIIRAVKPFTTCETNKRYHAKKLGYILGDLDTERYCIFYDDNTQRSELFERNCIAAGFSVSPLPNDERITEKIQLNPYRQESLCQVLL